MLGIHVKLINTSMHVKHNNSAILRLGSFTTVFLSEHSHIAARRFTSRPGPSGRPYRPPRRPHRSPGGPHRPPGGPQRPPRRPHRPPGGPHRPPGGPQRPPRRPHRQPGRPQRRPGRPRRPPGRPPPPPPPRHAGATTSRRLYRGRHSHVGGCICWYWNAAYYAEWTSLGCKSKGNRGCGAAVYNFRQGQWRWCEVTGDRGGKCKCYDNTSNRRVKCKNRK